MIHRGVEFEILVLLGSNKKFSECVHGNLNCSYKNCCMVFTQNKKWFCALPKG